MISSDGQVCWTTGHDHCLEAFFRRSLRPGKPSNSSCVYVRVCPFTSRMISSKQFTCFYWKFSKATVSVAGRWLPVLQFAGGWAWAARAAVPQVRRQL